MYNIGNDMVIEISNDGLIGYITILKDKDDIQLKNDEIVFEVKKYIKYGLDEVLIDNIVNKVSSGEKISIAEGKPPIAGEDGTINYKFNMEKPMLPKINPDGTVDYKELDSINKANKDDVLAEIVPPTEGVDGIKVTGEPILATNGRIPKFKYGKNVSISKDGMSLLSDASGLIEFKSGKVSVSELLTVENVDNSTGNIRFDGNVIVKKDILNGFNLKAGGSVEIKGAVEGGYIESSGDILIRQGIQGYNRETINTTGNLSSKFIENSIVNTGGNITAEAIMHSNISSQSNILVLGKKGLIVGGVCKAKFEIRAKTIGSTMATTTILEVGIDPNVKKDQEELEKQYEDTIENLKKIEQSLKVLEMLKQSNRLDEKKEKLYDELIKAQLKLNVDVRKLERDVIEAKEQTSNLSRGLVKVADTIYPGVKIVIGNSVLYVRDEMKRCTFYREDGDIRVGPY